MQKIKILNSQKTLTKITLAVFLTAFIFFPFQVSAASLSTLSDTMTRVKASTASSHDILFTLGGSTALDAGETVTVDFNEDGGGFAVDGASSVSGDFDFNDGTERTVNMGSCPAGANNVQIAVNDSTGVVTITACSGYTSSAAGATINLEYGTAAGGTDRVTNPSASTKTIAIVAAGDTGSLAVVLVADDQVVLSASVDPSITFSLSANTSDFGVLAPSVIDTAGTNITLTMGTNANNGYTVTVQDVGGGGNPGLWNSVASAIIGSADGSYSATADLTSAPAGYGLQASCTAGCTTATHVASDFRQGSDTVGGVTIAAKQIVNYTTATTSDHTVSVVHKAKASASTKAGSYTDTLTYLITGNF